MFHTFLPDLSKHVKSTKPQTWIALWFTLLLSHSFQGTGGITVKKTNLAIIIGIYDEPMTGGQCNMIVERLGDYLFDQGY